MSKEVEIPQGWLAVELSDIASDISYGYTGKSSDQPIGPRMLRITDIQNNSVNWLLVPFCEIPNELKTRYLLKKGDLVFARTGATVGKSFFIIEEIPEAIYASYLIRVRCSIEILSSYLSHYFKSPYYWNQITEFSSGIGQPNVNGTKLQHLRVYLPPLAEQRRITDKLDALLLRVDAYRDRLNRVSLLLKRFRQAVLAAATSGRLTKDWRNDGTDEGNWVYERAADICEKVQSGGTPREKFIEKPGVPFLKVYNIVNQRVDFEYRTQFVSESVHNGTLAKSRAKPGDVLMNIVGPPLGKVAIVPESFPEWNINQAITLFRPSQRVITGWLYYFLCSGVSIAEIVHETRGSAGQSNISLSQCRDFILPVPPIDEQQEIVRRVEILFAYADGLEARYQKGLAQVDRLTAALLSKAFRGELVLQDPNDEPTWVLLEKIQAEKAHMKTEHKTRHVVRRSDRKSTKEAMKEPSDYLEALHSAFVGIGRKADARQLFDHAGFRPEEVVQFYEALRATPEVRVVFEESVEERPQQQSSIIDSTDKRIITNGRFRLVELWLEDFKNLSDYTVCFDPSHSIDIVLGWNGTGKSNLFEALVIIFRDLHEWVERNRWTEKPMKGYRLRYQINELTVEVSWLPGEMKRPKLKMGILQEGTKEPDKLESISRGKLSLPRFVFGYYSGPTNRLAEHFLPMKQAHYTRLREATSDDPETLRRLLEQRQFFCAENHHAKYVLLAFCHKEDADISRFLEERLRIIGFESALFIIRKPAWARKGQAAEDFWGATGIMRRVMERLRRFAIAPMVVEQTVSDGYRSRREDHYYFFLPDLQSLHAFAAEYQDARTFFLALESTDFSELIYDLKLQVRVKATNTQQVAITFHELSEGEQQLLMVLGLMRFTKSHQSLVLLDEPDTHLNPHWSVEYLKLLTRVMSEDSSESEEQQTSQILMSTHDPLVIASLVKEQIHLLKRDWQTGVCKWDQPTVNPRGLGFTGILTSEMFGMRSDLDEETLADLDNKVRLVAKEDSLTPEEFAELEEINKRLEDAGFQKAFSDPYYAAFVRVWGRRHSELMAGVQFLSPEKQEEIDRIAREVLEEVIVELQEEAVD